jgi:hypothetical protein
MTEPFNAAAFSVLGFRDSDAEVLRDKPDFAAYAPSATDAKADRDAYKAARPDIHLWAVMNNATRQYTIALN